MRANKQMDQMEKNVQQMHINAYNQVYPHHIHLCIFVLSFMDVSVDGLFQNRLEYDRIAVMLPKSLTHSHIPPRGKAKDKECLPPVGRICGSIH